MGGRGGSSGITAKGGASIDFGGEKVEYFFYKKGNKNFMQRGIGGAPEEAPMNMSKEQFLSRAEKGGAKVSRIGNKEVREKEKKHKEERKKIEKYLDEKWIRGAGAPRKGWKGH